MCHKCKTDNTPYIAGLKQSKWNEPYNGKKTTLAKDLNKTPGVYLIKSKHTGKIKYVGHSATNLKRTLYRHFQQWNDKAQDRYVYDKNKYLIRVIKTTSKRAPELEKYLIDKYKPKDNKNKYTTLEPQDFSEDLKQAEKWKVYFNNVQDTPF